MSLSDKIKHGDFIFTQDVKQFIKELKGYSRGPDKHIIITVEKLNEMVGEKLL